MKIEDKDIVFVTTTLMTKWMPIQHALIKNFFPESQIMVFSGLERWPYSWFYWIEPVKKSGAKYFVHLDEDFFIENPEELRRLIQKMEDEDLSVSGTSDAYNQHRGFNPIVFNTFFMVGKVSDLIECFTIDPETLNIRWEDDGWKNNSGMLYKEEYGSDFVYPYEKMGNDEFYHLDREPWYIFFWLLKEKNKKFHYLYPRFNERFKSTDPAVDADSESIGIHMWYSRQWHLEMPVFETTQIKRYTDVGNYLLEKYSFLVNLN
jgi:hypothetical protein